MKTKSRYTQLATGVAMACLLLTAIAATPTASAQPNLVIRIDDQVVPSGHVHNFGAVPIGQSVPIVVVLRNEGNQNLEFTEDPPMFIFLGGGFPEQFELTQPPLEDGDLLSPNGSTAFRVDFVPTIQFQNINTTAFIFTNQQNEPFRVDFLGAGVAPNLVVRIDGVERNSGDTIAFEDTLVGEMRTITVVLRNEGAATLGFLNDPPIDIATAAPDAFDIVQPALEGGNTLSPNGSTAFNIVFMPQAAGDFTANVTIVTNDQDSPFALNVTASAQEEEGEVICEVQLDAAQEVADPPVDSDATGTGVFERLQDGSVRLTVTHDVENATVAHIHVGAAGVNGGIIIDLGSGVSPIVNVLTAAEYDLVTMSPHYINVHSTDFPDGEIRGQILCIDEEVGEDLCDVLMDTSNRLNAFYTAFGFQIDEFNDLAGEGLPDLYTLALVEQGGCLIGGLSLMSATETAFNINRAMLEMLEMAPNDGPAKQSAQHHGIIAAMALTSDAMADALTMLLNDNGYETTGLEFAVVECDAEGCMPQPTGNNGLFLVFDEAVKQEVNQPYAANGDFDGDDATNREEFDNVIAAGGGLPEFIAAATDPNSDGSEMEEEDIRRGCSSNGAASTPAGSGGDLALILLAVLTLLAVRAPARATKTIQ